MRAHELRAFKLRENILKAITKHIIAKGQGPEISDLTKAFGAGKGTISGHIAELRREGRLGMAEGAKRYSAVTVRLVDPQPVVDTTLDPKTTARLEAHRASGNKVSKNAARARRTEEKQEQFLAHVVAFMKAEGRVPTGPELVKVCRMKQTYVSRQLRALRAKGRIAFTGGRSGYTDLRILKGPATNGDSNGHANGHSPVPMDRQLMLPTVPPLQVKAWRMPRVDSSGRRNVAIEATDPTMQKLLERKAEYLAKVEFIDSILDDA